MRHRFWIVTTAALLALSTTALPATAQWRNGPGNDRDWRRSAGREAYERGYSEGIRRGEDDARRNRPFNIERDGVYRDGDRGYNRSYGNRDAYRDQFRRAFAEGYRNGYSRFRGGARGPYERGDRAGRRVVGGYQDPAFARGYSDGYEKGREDSDDGDRYDPVRHGDYRSADDGYRDEYGSKDAYRNNYRRGFRQGYEEGYRDFGRGRR